MDPTRSQPDPSPEAVAQGYENTTISARGLRWFLLCFALGLVVVFYIVWFALQRFASDARQTDQSQSIVKNFSALPSNIPSLQPSINHDTLPIEDLKALRAREDETFSHMGWKKDAKTGEMVIPDSVIRAVAKQRSNPATTQATSHPVSRTGNSNSGGRP